MSNTCECEETVSCYDEGAMIVYTEKGLRLVCGHCFDEDYEPSGMDCG